MFARNLLLFKFFNSSVYRQCSTFTKVEFNKKIATITMCHKPTRNSLSLEMMQDLITKINQYEIDENTRIIVIGAEGPIFSAGHNLKQLSSEKGREVQQQVFSLSAKLMSTIIDSPVPIIAKIDGLAAAAGCQLVAQCDLAFCTEKSTFSTPGANFGIFCSTPGVALARCVPKTTAMKMLLTGLEINSKEAEAKGLVTKVCVNLDEEMGPIFDSITAKSRAVITLGKRFFYQQINNNVKKAYDMGGEIMVENLNMDDGREGIDSFIQKRKPVWK